MMTDVYKFEIGLLVSNVSALIFYGFKQPVEMDRNGMNWVDHEAIRLGVPKMGTLPSTNWQEMGHDGTPKSQERW